MKSRVYQFSRTRNKAGKKGWGTTSIRRKLIRRDGQRCFNCKEEKKITDLEVEHTIPVAVSGEIFNLENLKLWCRKCHKNKTKIDTRVICCLKSLGVLKKNSILFMEPERVHRLYHRLFHFGSECLDVENNYLNDNYEWVLYKENRSVEG